MTFSLRFHEKAWAEWNKLDGSIRVMFKKKLIERLDQPHVRAAALSGMKNCYKIKLQSVGYRLVYHVDDGIVFVTVIAVGKREREAVYEAAKERAGE